MNTSQARARARSDVGRMTAAMRAATAPNAPRVLRVAVVVAGRIVEERVFSSRTRAEMGDVRFEVERGAWVLCAPRGAIGHVVLRGDRVAVRDAVRVVLDESARGKIIVGATTILFQLALAPPKASRPMLPLSVIKRDVDWPLTILAAMSFLFHFGVVGACFSDWLDPIVSEDGGAAVRLVDQSAPSAPQVVEEASGATGALADRHVAHAVPIARPAHTSSEASRAASLARDADTMKLSILGAFTGGPAVEAALRRSDVPLPDLARVAQDPRGAVPTGGEITYSGGAPTMRSGNLRDLGNSRGGEEHSGRERATAGPHVDVAITMPEQPTGVTDFSGTIAQLRPSFRSCYVHKGLDMDPAMEGKVTIDIAIAPNGDVADVTKVSGEGLSAAVESCILQRARGASFSAPGGRGAHARVPIVFRHQ
ncbi:MAG TPA: AgmX/PglI C-terminal domain-containing protein [Polyangiaceae bacterium]|jgi:hypothetical protein